MPDTKCGTKGIYAVIIGWKENWIFLLKGSANNTDEVTITGWLKCLHLLEKFASVEQCESIAQSLYYLYQIAFINCKHLDFAM